MHKALCPIKFLPNVMIGFDFSEYESLKFCLHYIQKGHALFGHALLAVCLFVYRETLNTSSPTFTMKMPEPSDSIVILSELTLPE